MPTRGQQTSDRESVFLRAAERWPEAAGEMRDLIQIEHALRRLKRLIAASLAHNHATAPRLTQFAGELADIGGENFPTEIPGRAKCDDRGKKKTQTDKRTHRTS